MNLEIALCCLETRITYLSVKLYNMMAHTTTTTTTTTTNDNDYDYDYGANDFIVTTKANTFFSLYLIGFGTNKYREVNYKF